MIFCFGHHQSSALTINDTTLTNLQKKNWAVFCVCLVSCSYIGIPSRAPRYIVRCWPSIYYTAI